MNAPPEEVDVEHRQAAPPANAGSSTRSSELLEPDRDQFRRPVEEVARLLRLLTFAGSHPLITDGKLLTAEEIADVLLDGVLRRPQTVRPGEPC